MMYYKQIEDNILVGIYKSNNLPLEEISEEEYNNILSIIKSKPDDTLESIYRLSAETNQYEAFARTHDETVEWYVQKIMSEEMTIDEVPTDYREEVNSIVNPTPQPSEDYLAGYDQAVLDMMGVE